MPLVLFALVTFLGRVSCFVYLFVCFLPQQPGLKRKKERKKRNKQPASVSTSFIIPGINKWILFFL
jgi:hypothetical protein